MMFLAPAFGKIKYLGGFVALTVLTNLSRLMNRSFLVIGRQLWNKLLKVLIKLVLILTGMFSNKIFLQYVIFIQQNILVRLKTRNILHTLIPRRIVI